MFNFGKAIEELKSGKKVARSGWNGKGMWLILVPGSFDIKFIDGSVYNKAGLESGTINQHIDMKTAREIRRKGWAGLETPSKAQAAIDLLVDYGHLIEVEISETGGRPKCVYVMNEVTK